MLNQVIHQYVSRKAEVECAQSRLVHVGYDANYMQWCFWLLALGIRKKECLWI